MDDFSSQTADPFEDRIRQMLNNDRPTVNVRLPPATNLPQRPPPSAPAYGTQYGTNSPATAQANVPTPPGMEYSHPSYQPTPPHLRHQGNNRNAMVAPPSGSRYHANPPQHHPPRMNGHFQGQRQFPLHPRGPLPQAGGQYPRGPSQHQQCDPPLQQGRHQSLDPDAFNRGGPIAHQARPALFDPNARSRQPSYLWNEARQRQAQYLEELVAAQVSSVDMTQTERDEKNAFRQTLGELCHQVCEKNPNLPKVDIECFGSFASGFASAGSDMDLVIVVQNSEPTSAIFSLLQDDLPRTLEDALLRAGYGARLLTRTRVPIIKVCQSPGDSLLDKLREEREKWDLLPNEKKYPHLFQNEDDDADDEVPQVNGPAEAGQKAIVASDSINGSMPNTTEASPVAHAANATSTQHAGVDAQPQPTNVATSTLVQESAPQPIKERRDQGRTWTRERRGGPLDFPKDGVGIQCDINFFNPLGLHNTHMLRCYSLCDPRVRPMVLFVKAWAKLRRINSSYSGTLSSYGFVMMVLHYLMNVAQPAVIPNLQLPWRPNPQCTPQGSNKATVDEWVVDFWRNEDEIQSALRQGQMSRNQESLGSLLAGFFQYYSSMGHGPQFRWTQQVLSIRTPGGIMTKDEKGWVKATTEEGEGKRIQHRYLFCIEDPFELKHNVARTVTHNGIVAIRDEFRRAQRILYAIGNGTKPHDGELFAQLIETEDLVNATAQMKLQDQMTPVGAAKQRSKQQRAKKSATPQSNVMEGAISRPRKSPVPKQQSKKQLDLADRDAFPTLGAPSSKKQTGPSDRKQTQANLAEDRRKKAEAQGEETANSAVEFLGL